MAVETIKEIINERYHLHPNERGDWELGGGIRLRTSAQNSFGFSLDTNELDTDAKPLTVFSDSPPQGIAMMCDAIVMLCDKNKLSIFIIEKKGAKARNYQDQLANGKLFCEWLISLCSYHGYFGDKLIEYIGLLIWGRRKSPRKGSSTHQSPSELSHPLFERCFDCNNVLEIPFGCSDFKLGGREFSNRLCLATEQLSFCSASIIFRPVASFTPITHLRPTGMLLLCP